MRKIQWPIGPQIFRITRIFRVKAALVSPSDSAVKLLMEMSLM